MVEKIIDTIEVTRVKTYKSLTKHHLSLNFEIGELIVEGQQKHGWGKSIVNELSKDINKLVDGNKRLLSTKFVENAPILLNI